MIMLMYLGERLLAVIFEVFGIDIEMIVVGGERLRALGNTGNKLLHLQQKHRRSAHYSQKASLGWRMEWHNLANGEEKMTSESSDQFIAHKEDTHFQEIKVENMAKISEKM